MKILDFSSKEKRYYSHDFTLCKKLDSEGYKWEIAIWHTPAPQEKDFIILALKDRDVRIAVIEKITNSGIPHDMYFVEINLKDALKKFNARIFI